MNRLEICIRRTPLYLKKARKRKKKAFLEDIAWTPILQPVHKTRATAGLFHGYRSDHHSMDALQKMLGKLGITTVAPDFPGHGQSANGRPGYFRDFLDLELVIHSLMVYVGKNQYRRRLPRFLIGDSMGALAVLSFLINKPLQCRRIDGVILIAPPLEVRHNSAPWVRNMTFALNVLSLALGRQTVPEWLVNKQTSEGHATECEVPAACNVSAGKNPPFRVAEQFVSRGKYVQGNLEKLNEVPMLVMHGKNDHHTCFETAKRSFGKLRKTTFLTLPPEAPHYIWDTKYETEIVSNVCDWIQRRI